jgi:hypothetical protein
MWGRYWLHLSDLTNRKETPPFSPAGPHIRRGLLDPTSFQKLRFYSPEAMKPVLKFLVRETSIMDETEKFYFTKISESRKLTENSIRGNVP